MHIEYDHLLHVYEKSVQCSHPMTLHTGIDLLQ